MTAGRPTLYNEEILKKTRQYIDDCEDEDVQRLKQSNDAKGYEMYENKVKVNLPTIEGLAYFLKISRDTIYTWCQEHEEFSDIIESLRAKQANALINNGLSGDYNSTIAKVLLTKHGYREGLEHSGEEGSPIKVDITKMLDKAYGNTGEVHTDS